MKKLWTALLAFALLAFTAAGCGKPTAQPTPGPDAAALAGLWEQFMPVESMPREITLDASGSAAVDNENCRWRLDGGSLFIRRGGQETRYSYTVSGYMMTLYDTSSDTSEFYINPQVFAAGADRNADFKGLWAAWSTFAMMAFDGEGGLSNIVYTTAGRTDLGARYAARDGILQTVDTGGGYTYNLYSFGEDGALLLAETTDYDNENKQWTAYWKSAAPPEGLPGSWTRVAGQSPGEGGFPSVLNLVADGSGSAAAQGGGTTGLHWEYYAGGFVIIKYSETDLRYAWCTPQGGSLFLGNPDVDEAWYIEPGRYKPSTGPLKDIAGTWTLEGSRLALAVQADGTASATNEAGETAAFAASAADGMLKLTRGGDTYYMSYSVDGDTMQLFYGQVPFLDQKEMPVTLTKK